MDRYRKILVAVDGSGSSLNALRQACAVGLRQKSWITALTVIPRYVDLFQTLRTQERVSVSLRQEGERILSDAVRAAGAEDCFVRTELVEGFSAEAIADTSEDGGYGLIVMGRHGKGGLERSLMGSVTARVVALSAKDILVVPDGSRIGFKNILLCADGSKGGEEAFYRAVRFALSYGGNLTAVSIVDVSEEFYVQAPDAVEQLIVRAKGILADTKKKAGESGLRADTHVKEGDAHQKIVELASGINADVIFIGSHGRTGLGRLIMGSVTEKVIGLAPCPVYVSKGA